MKFVFSGLEVPLIINQEGVTVLEIENNTLFARACQSLKSYAGPLAVEPYSIWDDGEKALLSKNVYRVISDPFDLPWSDRDFIGGLLQKMENLLLDNEQIKDTTEDYNYKLAQSFSTLGLMLTSDYAFKVEWDVRRYLKAFDFGIDFCNEDSLLDSLMKFLAFLSDISYKKVLMFVNLKTFLSEKDTEMLYEQAFFSKIPLLLLENVPDKHRYEKERKMHVDQFFLESVS